MSEIRKRKKKLEDDLELLEGDFENRILSVQSKLMGTLEPLEIIKKNPFKAVGTSVVIGLAIGLIGEKKRGEGEEHTADIHKEKLVHLLLNEFKRVAARKAASYLSDFIDKKIKK